MPSFVRAAISALAVLAALCAARAEDRPARLALVVGEGDYPGARLATAVSDAGLVATSLAQAGFSVTAVADADAATLRRAVAAFVDKARAAGPGVALAVYVSGDGLQYRGENWLVPVGPRLDRDDDIPSAAVRLTELTGPLEALPATVRLFLFDLARETPFARSGQPMAPGLALVDAPVGSVYAYNTAPGAMAPPDAPPYGAYARALAESMQAPGVTLDAMLRRVRLRVGERTDGAAVPFDDGSADPAFSIFTGPPMPVGPLPPTAGLTPSAAYSTAVARDTLPGYAGFLAAFPSDPLAGRVRAMAAARREALFWAEAVRVSSPRAYWTYLRRYPRGPHLADARRQLFALHAPLEPPPRFDIVPFEGLPPPPPEEAALLDHLTFADADGPLIPTPDGTLLPPPRRAFYDTLPMPPIAWASALPLPLPVPPSDGKAPLPGRIEQPAVPGSALLTTLGDGPVLTTVKADGGVISRLSDSVAASVRSVVQTAADGKPIATITVASSADGTVTLSQLGPTGMLLGRIVSREGPGGTRETTTSDGEGRPVAIIITTAGDIVKTSGAGPMRPPSPRFVLMPSPDAKGNPIVLPEPERRPEAVRTASTEQSVAPVVFDKPPPLPVAPGLTGEAPKLNLPPAPPAPAFEPSAPPQVPPASETGATGPAAPASATPAAATPTPATPALASPTAPVSGAASNSAVPTGAAPAQTALSPEPASRLPSEPPLPPPRAAHAGEPKPKRRAGR